MTKTQKIVSVIFKLIVAFSAFFGVYLCLGSSIGSFMGGATTLLYFTIQSNIWIGVTMLACAVIMIIELKTRRVIFPKWLYTLKQIFTVSITLTGIVFCAMIAPFFGKGAWAVTNILTHVIVPLVAILDVILFDFEGDFTYKKSLLSAIPPLYYLIFALIGYFANWNFGGGKNYPYAFLNYGGSAGLCGTSTDISDSLFIGSAYWIVILVVFVIGISLLYTKIALSVKKRNLRSSLSDINHE